MICYPSYSRTKTALIVKNLITLTQGASMGDLTSLEELVGLVTVTSVQV